MSKANAYNVEIWDVRPVKRAGKIRHKVFFTGGEGMLQRNSTVGILAKRYMAEGHFKPGSMLPKVQAAIEFLEGGGQQAIITDPEHLAPALAGKAGTRVVR